MSRKLLTNFNAAPYYDDFDLDKNFLKVLFNFLISLLPVKTNVQNNIFFLYFLNFLLSSLILFWMNELGFFKYFFQDLLLEIVLIFIIDFFCLISSYNF